MFYRTGGQSAVELVAGLMVVVPIVLLGIDVSTLFMGASLNDNVSREAARAASQGPPSALSYQAPLMRAKAVIMRYANSSTGAIRVQPHGSVTEQVQYPLPQLPYGGAVNGTVSVTTAADIYPPFVLPAVGMKVVTTHSTHTFNYSYTLANPGLNPTPGGNPPGNIVIPLPTGGSSVAGNPTGFGTGTGGSSGGGAGSNQPPFRRFDF